MDQITWSEFSKVDFRIGLIKEAVNVNNSDKLIRMVVDFGEIIGQKIVFSGIRRWYQPEDLVGKKTVFVVNMVPKMVMGEESGAMIFGAEDESSNRMSILVLEIDLPVGTKVF